MTAMPWHEERAYRLSQSRPRGAGWKDLGIPRRPGSPTSPRAANIGSLFRRPRAALESGGCVLDRGSMIQPLGDDNHQRQTRPGALEVCSCNAPRSLPSTISCAASAFRLLPPYPMWLARPLPPAYRSVGLTARADKGGCFRLMPQSGRCRCAAASESTPLAAPWRRSQNYVQRVALSVICRARRGDTSILLQWAWGDHRQLCPRSGPIVLSQTLSDGCSPRLKRTEEELAAGRQITVRLDQHQHELVDVCTMLVAQQHHHQAGIPLSTSCIRTLRAASFSP